MNIQIKHQDGTVLFDGDTKNLTGANLIGADLEKALSERTILPEGDLIGWKKLSDGTICKVSIPATAKRVGDLTSRKCRAEFVDVLEGRGTTHMHGPHTVYEIGERVTADKFDPDPLTVCSGGIHFFITQREAENY